MLRCVCLGAAMHNRNSGNPARIRFDFGFEQAQHHNDAMIPDAHGFEQSCSLKLNDVS